MASDGKHRASQMGDISQQLQKSVTDYSSHPLAEELVKWFTANDGWLNPHVHVVYNDSNGFHLRATTALSSPLIVTCPLKLTLSYLNLDHLQSAVPRVQSPLQKCLGKVPNHVLSYLLLVEQRYHVIAEPSRWKPYLNCLPETEGSTNPLWFDEHDMKFLAGTNLVQATKDKLNDLTAEWNQAVGVMSGVGVPALDSFTLERFLWAATIFSSRSFISTRILPDYETFPILFPVVDILNHTPDAKVEWEFNPLEDFTLKVVDHEILRPEDEIFNNYAPKQNDELLLGYGFCIQDNPVEQFAIKMLLPPPLETAARQLKLFEPDNVPFGMSTSFLDTDPKLEQHYLRTNTYKFGRYDNKVPFLRGIPPYIVHVFFIRALMNLNLHPENINKQRPAPRIVLEVLLLLHEAIAQKCQTLPLAPKSDSTSSDLPPKQKYISIYRNGQAAILHSILTELHSAISKRRLIAKLPPSKTPVIISTTEALITLATDFPTHYTHFSSGLALFYQIDITSWTQYGADISSLEEEDGERPAELSVWKLLLFLFAHLSSPAVRKRHGKDSVVYDWISNLLATTEPLPETGAYDEASGLSSEVLPEFVLGFDDGEEGGGVQEERRLAVWADEVVDRWAFPWVDYNGGGGEEGDREEQRICMYLNGGAEGSGDGWVYEEEG